MKNQTINGDSEIIRDFVLIDGQSRHLKSPYYQRLIQYTHSLIRALNGAKVTPDLESYCYRQLWLTRVEMVKFRDAFQRTITFESTPNELAPNETIKDPNKTDA